MYQGLGAVDIRVFLVHSIEKTNIMYTKPKKCAHVFDLRNCSPCIVCSCSELNDIEGQIERCISVH